MSTIRQKLCNTLEALDCNKEEIEIFLKIFTSNGLKASEVAERTGIKRNTCYRLLDELIHKGLIFIQLNKKINTYQAVNPHNIHKLLENKTKKIKKITDNFIASLDQFKQIKKRDYKKTQVSFYQKRESAKLLDQIISEHDFKAIFNPSVAFKHCPEILKKYIKNQNTSKQHIREIITGENPQILELLTDSHNPNLAAKASKDLHNFWADIIIFEKKVYIASYQSNVAIIIDDAHIAKSMNALHDFIWQNL